MLTLDEITKRAMQPSKECENCKQLEKDIESKDRTLDTLNDLRISNGKMRQLLIKHNIDHEY